MSYDFELSDEGLIKVLFFFQELLAIVRQVAMIKAPVFSQRNKKCILRTTFSALN
jgi:hypothetical protein